MILVRFFINFPHSYTHMTVGLDMGAQINSLLRTSNDENETESLDGFISCFQKTHDESQKRDWGADKLICFAGG
jgi:hypothetical protein